MRRQRSDAKTMKSNFFDGGGCSKSRFLLTTNGGAHASRLNSITVFYHVFTHIGYDFKVLNLSSADLEPEKESEQQTPSSP